MIRLKSQTVFQEYAREIDSYTNMKVIAHDSRGMVYEVDGVDGSGTVEVLTLFSGIFLQFHSFHCKSFHIPAAEGVSRGLKINYCSEGRMEVRMSDNLCLFMEPGTLSMDMRTAQDSFQFPCGHYHGIELFLHDDMIGNGTPDAWDGFGIDLKQVKHRFCGDGKSYVIFADDRFRSLFQSISDAPQGCRLEYLQIKAAELLLLMQNVPMPCRSETSTLMTTGQVEIAKQVRDIIMRDLSRHHSIESLAASFGVSASSVKNYFQGVYGKNISTYLREARMSAAAIALRDGREPVGEIASAVGYENASKFSAAFKSYFGDSPLEYRRQSRCGI